MMPKILLLYVVLIITAAAQTPVAPTPEAVGTASGENAGTYNILNSFEVGSRYRSVGGNLDSYRSQVNFGDGIRLLGGTFRMNSTDGRGRFFDELVFTSQGLGNDPYEAAALRLRKSRYYVYNLSWRDNQYFNPGLRTGNAQGQHLLDTDSVLQDHDLTLLPDSKVRFFLGYTRSSQTGAGISTVQLFDSRGDEFPQFANILRRRNEYRVGNEFRLFGIRVNWSHVWEDFKEDTRYELNGLALGNNPADRTTLTAFQRNEPYHGSSPSWRADIFADRKLFSINGRFTYTGGQRAFVLDERAMGTSSFGTALNQQIFTTGNANRPVATGNLTFSLFPTDKLSFTEQVSVYNVRTEGDSTYIQIDNATQAENLIHFRYLGIRTIANDAQLNYQATRWLGVYGGYQYSNRRIGSEETFGAPSAADAGLQQQTNELHAGVAGVRMRLSNGLSVTVDGELGRTSQPFTPVSDKDYHSVSGTVRYRRKSLQLSASTQAKYNANSVSLSSYSSNARTYSGAVTWTPREWLSFDASYTKLHLNTVGGIAYFVSFQLVQGDRSIYVSNIHSGNLGVRLAPWKRVDFFAGYSHVQDIGHGCADASCGITGVSLPAFVAARTFPVTFLSPSARVSVKISEKVRWNFGYQYYGYQEKFYRAEGYRANTGYTSVLWSF